MADMTDLNHKNISMESFLNTSVEDLLLSNLGPRRHDLPVVILLLTVYCLIFISGVLGNICTCIVIVKNNYMQTTTNYYLFSLAISDVLSLIFGLPPEAYAVLESYPWTFGEAFCLFKSCLFEMTACVSVLTITAFTIERYIAICYPLKAHKIASLSRTIKIVVAIWVFAFCCALPYPVHTRTFYYLHTKGGMPIQDSLQCNIPHKWVSRMKIVFQLSTILFFAFPMSVITVLYILIALTLRKTSLNRSGSDDGRGNQQTSINAVLRMLVAVVVAFFVCWAPFHAQRLMTLYITDWSSVVMQAIQRYLFYISGVLFFVGSTVNPILYNVMSVRYRQAFRETLGCCFVRNISNRNKIAYTYIKPSNRVKCDDELNYYQNMAIKKSFDDDDNNITVSNGVTLQTRSEDGSSVVVCPSCNYGSSKKIGVNNETKTGSLQGKGMVQRMATSV